MVPARFRATARSFASTGRSLRVTRHRIPWPELPDPRRVLHLTDVHVGWTTPSALLDRVVTAARAESPDLVALTGDYVNLTLGPFHHMERLVARLPAPVVAVLGNHDHLVGSERIRRRLEAAGAQVLQNRWIDVGGLPVVGVDDGFTRADDVEAAFAGLPLRAPALVLTHFPPTAVRIARRGGRLVLAGHTHAGQVALPSPWGERVARLALLGTFLRGSYDLPEGARLYVNAGLGHARPGMRWGEVCRPEVAVFDLVPEGARPG